MLLFRDGEFIRMVNDKTVGAGHVLGRLEEAAQKGYVGLLAG